MSNLYENEKYAVTLTDDALGEDGNYGRRGYAVVNKKTAVVEHSTTVLPQAIGAAEAFVRQLEFLMAVPDDDAIAGAASDEPDVLLPN